MSVDAQRDDDADALLENLGPDEELNQPAPHRRAVGAALLIAGLLSAGLVFLGGDGSRSRLRRAATGSWAKGLLSMDEEEEAPWECHRYAVDQGQDNAWCQSVGSHDGYDILWVGEEANVCAECWCCHRPAVNLHITSSRKPVETSVPTPMPTPAPTPRPTLSPQEFALKTVRAQTQGMQEQADSYLEEARRQGKVLRDNAEKYALKLVTTAQSKHDQLLHKAEVNEEKALKAVAKPRVCVDLIGVELKGYTEVQMRGLFSPVLNTSEACRYWCQAQVECGMAVFNSDDSSCKWFTEHTEEPVSWKENLVSSYCSGPGTEKQLLAKLDKVFEKKAWFPQSYDCAWAGESCAESRCCANACKAPKDFSSCDWYTCYQKDEYFAGCESGGAPKGWNGTALGGHPTQEVPKAKEGQLTQGTSLFCFVVVLWDAGPTMIGTQGEGVVANGWKNRGLHVLQCDEHQFVEGWPTGSVHNIDSFSNAWNEVRSDGRWANHDWVVKADPDAVFFPERLKWHLDALRTPLGAPVYLRNNYYKFHFMGALEVLSREALEMYFEKSYQCDEHVGRQGGEDYWLLQCLEGIGVNYQSDYDLLFDKYAAQNGCESDWAVAFHFYKSVDKWDECHDTSMNNWYKNNPQQPDAVFKK